ncbi:MAG: class I SAM-dependent methyltransferase [Armatimonadetes bacterium]|nr:class I SAM-dependent methyltransferase [Armatimonadota bacterium]
MVNTNIKKIFFKVASEYINSNTELAVQFKKRGGHHDWRRPTLLVNEISKRLNTPEAKFLDIGTGHGIIPRMIKEFGNYVISVDWPASGGTDALKALMGIGIEGYYVHVGNEPIPIQDSSVDVAFAGDVIEHIPHNPIPFLTELIRVIRPSGVLILDTPNSISLYTRLKILMGQSNWPSLDAITSSDINIHHHKEYTLSELKSLLNMVGLKQVSGYTYETFWFKSVKKHGKLGTIGTDPSKATQFSVGFNPLKPYEYVRLICLVLVKIFPSFRSSILASGRIEKV